MRHFFTLKAQESVQNKIFPYKFVIYISYIAQMQTLINQFL